jgi:taurine dioxygenase
MTITVRATEGACGAFIEGLDLSSDLDQDTVKAIRNAWLEHHVVVFPNQALSVAGLERFTQYFGGFGRDPFFAPIDESEHVCAIERRADESTSVFAENWHTDWSFQPIPPAATCLLGLTIPPIGGNTDFTDQHKALAAMPTELRERLEGKIGIHSAKLAYSPDGMYSDPEKEADRSMRVVISEEAYLTETHPIIRKHPETGEEGIFSSLGYIVGVEGMSDEEALPLLMDLQAWQTREEFQYHHEWQKDMLVMWDNRSVLHKANGGYEGHDRLLHRTTVADDSSFYL